MKTIVDIITDEVFGLYEKYGNLEYGESVSQLEHMSQCAQYAINEGYDDEVILAAFFHDIGHFLDNAENNTSMDIYGTMDHETIGAEFLKKRGFSSKIAKLVASHVPAKRYLTFVKPFYFLELSDASKNTLKLQGGPMNEMEAKAFERDVYFHLYLKIREWDDRAKVVGLCPDNIETIKSICRKYLSKRLLAYSTN